MQINLNPTSERGASRDAVNRPRETLGDSHLISSDPRSRFGLVCDLLCCRGNSSYRGRYTVSHRGRYCLQAGDGDENDVAHLQVVGLRSCERGPVQVRDLMEAVAGAQEFLGDRNRVSPAWIVTRIILVVGFLDAWVVGFLFVWHTARPRRRP